MKLLAASHSLTFVRQFEYNELPRLPVELRHPKFFFVANQIFQCFQLLWVPLLQLSASLISRAIVVRFHTLPAKRITPQCQARLGKVEKKVQMLAKNAGIASPHKIKVYVENTIGGSPGAFGTSISQPNLLFSPEWLIRRKDLPEYLKLDKLNKNEITDEQWIAGLEKWLANEFMMAKNLEDDSQYDVDRRRLWLKIWLRYFRDKAKYKKFREMIVGHELGHLYYNHQLKAALIMLGWHVLSLLTGGPLVLLTDRVMGIVNKRFEYACDRFSAIKFGTANIGQQFFTDYQGLGKDILKKYGELSWSINPNGDIISTTHPLASERIKALLNLECADSVSAFPGATLRL